MVIIRPVLPSGWVAPACLSQAYPDSSHSSRSAWAKIWLTARIRILGSSSYLVQVQVLRVRPHFGHGSHVLRVPGLLGAPLGVRGIPPSLLHTLRAPPSRVSQAPPGLTPRIPLLPATAADLCSLPSQCAVLGSAGRQRVRHAPLRAPPWLTPRTPLLPRKLGLCVGLGPEASCEAGLPVLTGPGLELAC